jgi:hypothetical protein
MGKCPVSSAPSPWSGALQGGPRYLPLGPFCRAPGDNMTGDESRKLKIGDRVRWKGGATNQGRVRGTSWSGVTIDWDDGDSTSASHNDMTPVDRVVS